MIERYSIPLALIGLPPVLLSATGLFLLARMLKRKNELIGELAFVGATLLVAGQLIQAAWKLLNAASGADYHWMTHAPVAMRAPGAVCLAWALWQGLRDRVNGGEMTAGRVWLLPLALNAVLLALTAASRVVLGGRAWFTILFTAAILSGFAISFQLARRAIHHHLIIVALLFLVNLLMSLVLDHWVTGDADTQTTEWIKQISNTISQAAFAFATFQLARKES